MLGNTCQLLSKFVIRKDESSFLSEGENGAGYEGLLASVM